MDGRHRPRFTSLRPSTRAPHRAHPGAQASSDITTYGLRLGAVPTFSVRPRCTIVSTNDFLSSHRSVSSPAGTPAAQGIVLKGNGLRPRDAGARGMRTHGAMLDTTGANRRPTVLIASHQESSSRSLESILGPNGYTVLKAYTA